MIFLHYMSGGSMSFKNFVVPAEMESFASSSLTASYQALSTGLDRHCLLVSFVNNGDTAVTLSWDGATDHHYLPAKNTLVLDLSANNSIPNDRYVAKKGQIFYGKGTAGTTGSIYISGYGRGEN